MLLLNFICWCIYSHQMQHNRKYQRYLSHTYKLAVLTRTIYYLSVFLSYSFLCGYTQSKINCLVFFFFFSMLIQAYTTYTKKIIISISAVKLCFQMVPNERTRYIFNPLNTHTVLFCIFQKKKKIV